jgi:GNAT superfamily N-acetyltransferase
MSASDHATAVEVRDMRREETGVAVGLLARGMLDNPLNVAAYGEDAESRRRSLERMFTLLFKVFRTQRPLCAVDDTTMVAVAGVAPAGTCQATALQRLRFLPSMAVIGPRAATRVANWQAAWGTHDPRCSHSHLGPVAVEPRLQGRGIGSLMMREYCRRLDEAAEVGYLETDKSENVPFYERHGFDVIDRADVIGVPNWFMLRESQPSTRGGR